ncbi:MAG: hypothetical protein IT579_24800, partial [Verrucomicrobia subdivision 3 bacterium]|nr:hypothetical protein [Limisphaerales bacterium]
MTWIAPAETASANAALEQRLWDTADQFRANSGLMFLRFAAQRAKHLVPVTALLLHCCGCHSTAPRATPATVSHVQKPKVVRGVLPLVIQPDPAKWRRLQAGMTEGEVTALLG